jgi:hypothetical protein
MKNVIQNLVGVVVVAGLVYGSVVYGVDTSSTMRKDAQVCLMGSCVGATEQDRLNEASAIITTYTEGKQEISTKDYISMMEELSCVEETPRIRYYQGQEIKCKR